MERIMPLLEALRMDIDGVYYPPRVNTSPLELFRIGKGCHVNGTNPSTGWSRGRSGVPPAGWIRLSRG